MPGVEASPRIPLPRSRLIEVTLDAVRAFDSAGYAQSLLQATRTMTVPELFDDFVTALLAEIRAQIAAGEMRVAHERFAWAYLRDFLGDLLASSGAAPWSSTAVISTPEGDHREAAALMAAVTASRADTGNHRADPNRGACACSCARLSARIVRQPVQFLQLIERVGIPKQ